MLAVLAKHQDDAALLERVSHHQVMLGALLQVRGILPTSLFNQVLIDYNPEQMSIGEHLVARGLITAEVQEALAEQAAELRIAYQMAQEVA